MYSGKCQEVLRRGVRFIQILAGPAQPSKSLGYEQSYNKSCSAHRATAKLLPYSVSIEKKLWWYSMRFQVYRECTLENHIRCWDLTFVLEILSILFPRNYSSEVQISHFSFPGSVCCARDNLFLDKRIFHLSLGWGTQTLEFINHDHGKIVSFLAPTWAQEMPISVCLLDYFDFV